MSDIHLFHSSNQAFMLEMYQQYLQDPESVDPQSRAFFDAYSVQPPPGAGEAVPAGSASHSVSAPLDAAIGAVRLARFIRLRGHLEANINPLASTQPHSTELDISTHGLTSETLALLPGRIIGGPLASNASSALEAIALLRQAYSGTTGYEDEHIQDARERYWLREASESGRFLQGFDPARKRDLLMRLTEVDIFEDFLQKNFQGEKRFSLEGCDALVPVLDEIVKLSAEDRCHEVVVGMAHRGRLNVLAHVLGKPYATLLQEFKKNLAAAATAVSGWDADGWSGDVKYHLGYQRAFREAGVAEMPITLVPNPSHLEFVNPVVEGHARAAQERRSRAGEPLQDTHLALPVVIHGDAAFPGQGIVAETLNLSRLPGYRTGGTIHIIVNNQIGFTTLPHDGRSTLYASDLAKGFEIPIVHVNADDPIACVGAARMAFAYRQQFGKDFLIDLVGYRRYGHNEGDEPRTTQPRMYTRIDAHPRPREIWARELEKQGLVSRDEALEMANQVRSRMRAALDAASQPEEKTAASGATTPTLTTNTAVPAKLLTELNEALLTRPSNFTFQQDTERRFYLPRRDAINQPGGILWAHAESLALASILTDGVPIRLSGQDVERGTFDQRRLVLHDIENGARYVPLQHLPQAHASFAVYNSPLSENAALGFEYGYSIHAPSALTLWEAQFGDFSNGAQVIIDQFIAAGRAKWRQTPSLVLLLPHGYEGQGPDHSSARIERYLQLAAEDNLRIANCTTASQYFHLLRHQAALLETAPRPLIIFTPKSLLRDRNAACSLTDLSEGSFQPVLGDVESEAHAGSVTRAVICSGKVYVNLRFKGTQLREELKNEKRIAVLRLEQLHPFPEQQLAQKLAEYPHLKEIVWLQEEPKNMGPWSYCEPHLREIARSLEWNGSILYRGRDAAASTAEGFSPRHRAEQERLITSVIADVPAGHTSRSAAKSTR